MVGTKKTVFLDRDGTVSIDRGYTCRPEDMRIFPGAGTAIAGLKRAGFQVAIVTNQSAIGRGMASQRDVESTNEECLRQLLHEDSEAAVDLVVYCPHTPDENCECRKPKTGLVQALTWQLDTEESWLVGDKCSDLRFGLNLGLPRAQCLLVLTGEGEHEQAEAHSLIGIGIVSDLGAAAALIAGRQRNGIQ